MGNTILDEAIDLGLTDIIEYLLDHDALSDFTHHIQGTNEFYSTGQTPSIAARISKAIFIGDEELASNLIFSNQSQTLIDIALQSCSLFNAPALAEDLLEHGASLATPSHNGRTPLHLAAKRNLVGLTKVFVEHGAIIGIPDYGGSTPLDLALSGGIASIETTKFLIESGALATQGNGQDLTPVKSTDSMLEGR